MSAANDQEITELRAAVAELTAEVRALRESRRGGADELWDECMPIGRLAMESLSARLDVAERAGWFAFLREAGAVANRVVSTTTPEDVRRLGDNITAILDTVKSLTQPDILGVVNQVSDALRAEAAPVGLTGLVRASRDAEVKKGFGVGLALLRALGRAANHAAPSGAPRSLHSMLAARGRSTVQRALPPPVPVAAERVRAPAPPPRRDAPSADTCGVAVPVADPGAVLANWSHDAAEQLAASLGLTLTDAHWALIAWVRHEFQEAGRSPNIRRISEGAGVAIRDIYALFPKGPAKTLAQIAGIPKPAGCI